MTVISLLNGKSFPSLSGVTILDSAAAANVRLAYSCRNGRCNTCIARVVSGDSEALQPETTLSEVEKAGGVILCCVRRALTDMVLDVEDLDGLVPPPSRILPCRVYETALLSSDVLRVTLRLPPQNPFIFLPGQYLDLIGPGGLRRSYSIAGSHPDENMVILHVRRLPGGAMSSHLFDNTKAGDLMRIDGPHGTFVLRNLTGRDLVFLATGTGIAPIIPMLESIGTLVEDQRPRAVCVYWGGRQPQDFYLDKVGKCGFIPVLSQAKEDWAGARGYVQDAFLASGPDLENTVVYAAGSQAMVSGARQRLMAVGLPQRQFLSDAFVPSGRV